MTRDRVLRWLSEDITTHLRKYLNASLEDLNERSPIRNNVDQTAIQAAYSEGEKNAIREIKNYIQEGLLAEVETNDTEEETVE